MADNDLGPLGARHLSRGLQLGPLRELDIKGNDIGDEGAEWIAAALEANANLTTLDLGYNYIGPRGVRAIADALRNNTALRTLSLYYDNEYGAEGAVALAEMLKVNEGLHTLNLRGNAIGVEGARAFAAAVRAQGERIDSTLRYLDLDDTAEV